MANLQGFDATMVEPAGDFTPVPAGKYLVIITDSELKQTAAGTGSYLKLTFQIREGECKGRKLWLNLNLNNPNAEAVQIARGQLSGICRAVNVLKPADSQQLHNLPLLITVAVKPRKDNGEMENRITAFAAKDGAQVAQPKQPTAFSTGSTPPPWANKQPQAQPTAAAAEDLPY